MDDVFTNFTHAYQYLGLHVSSLKPGSVVINSLIYMTVNSNATSSKVGTLLTDNAAVCLNYGLNIAETNTTVQGLF